jgi:hypothetical protein
MLEYVEPTLLTDADIVRASLPTSSAEHFNCSVFDNLPIPAHLMREAVDALIVFKTTAPVLLPQEQYQELAEYTKSFLSISADVLAVSKGDPMVAPKTRKGAIINELPMHIISEYLVRLTTTRTDLRAPAAVLLLAQIKRRSGGRVIRYGDLTEGQLDVLTHLPDADLAADIVNKAEKASGRVATGKSGAAMGADMAAEIGNVLGKRADRGW